ncbi:hypothetical protein ACHAXR_006033, partial [Thalassiosira sp. AJA248-18]
MIILRLFFLASLLLGNEFNTSHANTGSRNGGPHPDVLISNLLEWLRANGAYINEKLLVKHLVPDDPSSPRGIFAIDALEAGETVCSIPPNLIVRSNKELMEGLHPQETHCGTIKAVMKAMDGDDSTPYGRYLLAQPNMYCAGFWSKAGRGLLADMLKSTRTEQFTESDELPPRGVDEVFDDLEKECNGDLDDPLYIHAAMLVQARADYEFMVPFYDMMNHDNGKTNVKHKYDGYKRSDLIDETGYQIVASKPIQAGGELYNSYNQCNICDEIVDWVGTPEMFMNYGFVEPKPQRWLFDFARVKFDLDWKDGDESTGEVVVDFLVPPSEKGIRLLQEELTRMESFSILHRNKSYEDYEGMSKYEWESLWQYYDALHEALSYATHSNEPLVDDVWELNDNWWVQDGTLTAADDEEHYV